ncbi:Phosphoribosylanthranilate isomerase [hydrothermal vent metagenome]|uniref:phosphoribosylanthranilate isomerase n=1 Tax=hydrothermal vent metagenome TaxID=652676 RepID=A0A3B0RY72_9ZZZZ
MIIHAKICGLSTRETVKAAVDAGASHLGFVFFAKSPRNISPEQVAELCRDIPLSVIKTGVFVDPENEQLDRILAMAPLDLLQLHGSESPARVQEVKARFKRPVMKAIALSDPDDMAGIKAYESCADMLLFDAKAPPELTDALPGGNGRAFDWNIIHAAEINLPWMLSGGLNMDNIAEAIAISGAQMIDVSSGVESRPGQKDIAKIKAFMNKVNSL